MCVCLLVFFCLCSRAMLRSCSPGTMLVKVFFSRFFDYFRKSTQALSVLRLPLCASLCFRPAAICKHSLNLSLLFFFFSLSLYMPLSVALPGSPPLVFLSLPSCFLAPYMLVSRRFPSFREWSRSRSEDCDLSFRSADDVQWQTGRLDVGYQVPLGPEKSQ